MVPRAAPSGWMGASITSGPAACPASESPTHPSQGLNVSGYHFHFITADRSAGGHVLGCKLAGGELYIDHEGDLQLELPPDVDLPAPDQSAEKGETLDRIERE
jgi:hypothetical protein